MMALRCVPRPILSRRDVMDAAQTRLAQIAMDMEARAPTQRNFERNAEDLETFAERIRVMARGERERIG